MKFALALIIAAALATARAVELTLANPVTLTVVVDRVDLVEEFDGLAVGSNRVARAVFEFDKPLNVSTNGVELLGRVSFRATVAQDTTAIATADGTGKTYDNLTRARQALISRREALSKLRPVIVAAKERVAPATP